MLPTGLRGTLICVPDGRTAMADIATEFYRHLRQQAQGHGCHRDKWKTTTAFLVKHLLDADQRRCGLIGTVNIPSEN